MPFEDFSPEGNQTWFADGLAEEILNSLARTTDLEVASRTSSFAYRGSTADIPSIAEALDVDLVTVDRKMAGVPHTRCTVRIAHAD